MSPMHDYELDVDLDLARKLIDGQFPEYAALPITPAASRGTVNNIYRLGDEFYIRLPRMAKWTDLEKEVKWLPRLAPHLTLKIPEPIALGEPTADYPAVWAVYRWLDGSTYAPGLVSDEQAAAESLAGFVRELRSIAVPADAPPAGRAPLERLHDEALSAIEAVGDLWDPVRLRQSWEESLGAEAWDGQAVWIHADLLRSNLLADRGRLSAVIDFGTAGAGDPAFDLIPAWTIFGRSARETYRSILGGDSNTWLRARGYALYQALLIIPYYQTTFPEFTAYARKTVDEILLD